MKVIHLVEKNPVRKGYGGAEYDSYSARYEFSRGIDIYKQLDIFAAHAEKMEMVFEITPKVGRPYKIREVTSKNLDQILYLNMDLLKRFPWHHIDIYLDNGVKVIMGDADFSNIYARSTGNDAAYRLEEYFEL